MRRARIEPRPTPDGITPVVAFRGWMLSVDPVRWMLCSMNGAIAHE